MLEYDDNSLKPRSSCFKNFRQYENLHMLFWIAKDLAWNRLNLGLWLVCLIPTILLAADFILISAYTAGDVSNRLFAMMCLFSFLTLSLACRQDSTVDVVHFLVMLMWVLGNSVWAIVSAVSSLAVVTPLTFFIFIPSPQGDFFFDDYDEPIRMWIR